MQRNLKILLLILAADGLGDVIGHFGGDFAESVFVSCAAAVCVMLYIFHRRKQASLLGTHPTQA